MEKSDQPVEEMKMLVGMEVEDEQSAAVKSTDDVSSFMDEFNRYCTLSTQQETLQTKFEEANNQWIQKSPNELYWEVVERYTPSIVEELEQMVQAMQIEMKAKMQTQLAAHLAELKRRNKELMDETLSRMPNAMRTEMEAEMQTQFAAHVVEMEVEMQTKLAAHMAEMERGNKELIDKMLTRMFGVRDPNTFSTILPQH